MKVNSIISGFSKLDKESKLNLIAAYYHDPEKMIRELRSYWHQNKETQRLFDEFSENTVSNFFLPYGIAPNFVINGKQYFVPMVIEESSVVAAASSAAKFWAEKGGFKAEVISTKKIGQVHFIWNGDFEKLKEDLPELKEELIAGTSEITANMTRRGGGITGIELVDMSSEIENYYQLKVTFETVDSMGANFINSCLEEFAQILKEYFETNDKYQRSEKECEIIMSILSNYTPDCLVKVYVETEVRNLTMPESNLSPEKFVWKFNKAVEIANTDVHRATTHNKGVFNGIDAVILATGNDFRATEAGGHTYAARSGKYRSLTSLEVKNDIFHYELEIPMALGTVGGLTSLHPMAKLSLEILDNPRAEELMMIAASVGLANNYSAVKSLITKGIQVGHMKMHLFNILNYFHASTMEKEKAVRFFEDKKVSFSSVSNFITDLRTQDLDEVNL